MSSPSITTASPNTQEQAEGSVALHRGVEGGATGGKLVGDEAEGGEAVGAVGGRPSSPATGHDDAAFREKLKHMGKSMFVYLYLFTIVNNKSPGTDYCTL